MKKILLILALAAVSMPVAAFANHLNGTWGGWGSNYISIGIGGGGQQRFSHGGNVTYVDDYGAPYDYHSLRPGHPITVDYAGRHGHEHVNRVVVHKWSGHHRRGH